MSSDVPLTSKGLEAYALCPMKYRLHRLGGRARSSFGRVEAGRALHAAIRQALNECYRMGGPRRFPVERLVEVFANSFDGRAATDSREEDECRSTGARLLSEYHADHLHDAPCGVAVDFRVEREIGGLRFEARADRRESTDDGRVVLVLYTTARRPPSENALEDDLQTGILQLVAQQAEGREVAVQVHALRKRKALDASKPAATLQKLRDRVVALATAITEASEYPTVRARHCRWCRTRGVCPEWARE